MCLFALFAAFAPRLAMLFLWAFTPMVNRAFQGFLLPLLGTVFLPFATLFYVLFYIPGYGLTAWGWLGVILGALIDLGGYGRAARSRRRQTADR